MSKEHDKRVKKAKKGNETLECGICCQEDFLIDDMVECTVGHLYCRYVVHRSKREKFIVNLEIAFEHMWMCVFKKANVVLHVWKIPVRENIRFPWSMNFYLRNIFIDYINEFKKKIFDKV